MIVLTTEGVRLSGKKLLQAHWFGDVLIKAYPNLSHWEDVGPVPVFLMGEKRLYLSIIYRSKIPQEKVLQTLKAMYLSTTFKKSADDTHYNGVFLWLTKLLIKKKVQEPITHKITGS